MYNNEVTYAKCWSNKETKKYDRKIQKYLQRAQCMSDCPSSWVKEVYELLEHLDKTFGIARNTGSLGGFYLPNGGPLKWIFVDPVIELFKKYEPPKQEWMKKYEPTTRLGFLWKRIKNFKHKLRYGIRTAFYIGKNEFLNWLLKPQIYIGQIKEKYGTLRIYFTCNDRAIDQYIEAKVDELEFKLAQKGAYYDLVDMMGWNSSWSTKYDGGWEVEPNLDDKGNVESYEISKYTYRQIARNLLSKEEFEKLLLTYQEREARKAEEEAKNATSSTNSGSTNTP